MNFNCVVVTGLGVVSSIGIGKNTFWENLVQGKSGISKITLFDTSNYERHFAGEIKEFNPAKYIPKRISKYLERASQFAIGATHCALEDAGVSLKEIVREKNKAIIMGTTLPEGSIIDSSSKSLLNKRFSKITQNFLINLLPTAIVRNTSFFTRFKGVNLLTPTACSAGNYSLSYGYDLIKRGDIDFALVGGAEALSRITFQGFNRLCAMSQDVCSPFDKNRSGMLLGEGAGVLILESLERALKRKANIYAEVLGYGLSCDAFNMTIPRHVQIKKAMEKALKNSKISPDEVDYINAHGTGTKANDKEEVTAIKEVFGERYKNIPVSAIKSMLGHCLGAASAIEAVSCCLSLKEVILPPTINYHEVDSECDVDCVPNHARKKKIKIALNNGFAFGGNNCCVVFSNLS